MYKYHKKKTSLLFTLSILLIIVIFGVCGSTLAYFSVQKNFTAQYSIGVVEANWYNYNTALTDSNLYTLSNVKLKRGDSAGTNLLKTDGSAGGDLRITSTANSASQYLRVKPKALVGKNYFDISKVKNHGNYLTNNNDGSMTADLSVYPTEEEYINTILNAGPTLEEICPDLVPGETYTISADCDNGVAMVALVATLDGNTIHELYSDGQSFEMTEFAKTMHVGWGSVYAFANGQSCTISNLQVEKGEEVTSYEDYCGIDVDVSEHFTFNYKYGNNTSVAGSASFWPQDSEGWFYRTSALDSGSYAIFCNNVSLKASYPTIYTNKSVRITFEFESLQSANNPVADTWGDEAALILGL